MVKTLSIALVVLVLLVAQSSSQEVFSGEQKAKPKYPKAQPLASEHVEKNDVHVEKAIPVPADKIAAKTKRNAPLKPVAAASVKAAAPVAKLPDVSSKTTSATSKIVHKESAPAAPRVQTAASQHSASKPAMKSVPKVEIAVAKEDAPVSAPAEGPNQKAKSLSKTAAAKTTTLESTAVHTKTAQTSPALKPSVGKGDPKIEVKGQISAAVAAGNTKPAGTKIPTADNSLANTSAAQAAGSKPSHAPRATTSGQPIQHITRDVSTAEPAVADVAHRDQKPEIKVQSTMTASTPVVLHKETTAPASARLLTIQNPATETTIAQPMNNHFDTAFTKLADGFDFPIGKPDAQGYYKARGFRSRGHLGEDWDGVRGGDTDLGDPIYSVGDGLVVFARDCHMGWGNVLIVRHSYREGGTIKTVDALYGHLQSMLVRRGQAIARGQRIATMGNAHGLYDAHLHLEIRKNLEIGMSRAAFAQDFSNYYDPTQFIQAHRHLQTGGGSYRVAMNTFTRDANIKWDKTRNYSHAHTGGGSNQSAAALKKALAAKH